MRQIPPGSSIHVYRTCELTKPLLECATRAKPKRQAASRQGPYRNTAQSSRCRLLQPNPARTRSTPDTQQRLHAAWSCTSLACQLIAANDTHSARAAGHDRATTLELPQCTAKHQHLRHTRRLVTCLPYTISGSRLYFNNLQGKTSASCCAAWPAV